MPLIDSNYNPPRVFKNGHVSTLYAALVRKVNNVKQQRERLWLNDGDFIDVDWSFTSVKTNKVIIVLHGLEGNAQRPYMLGVAKYFSENGFDVACVNFRGCSGEPNIHYRSYHSGETQDLQEVIDFIINKNKYSAVFLKGFSLGGNVILKYLGENKMLVRELKAAVAVSVPCNLYDAMLALHEPKNFIYSKNFKYHLVNKLKQKHELFNDCASMQQIKNIKTLKDFDDVYTAPAHGFKDALDYYYSCSALRFLDTITIPTLVLNAQNDSFLAPSCYPIKQAQKNQHLFLEMPKHGGHVGFYDTKNIYYNEKRALQFINTYVQ